jgi:hypothetical protein
MVVFLCDHGYIFLDHGCLNSPWLCQQEKISMVAYFCPHLSDNYVDLSDDYVDLSDLCVDLSLVRFLKN